MKDKSRSQTFIKYPLAILLRDMFFQPLEDRGTPVADTTCGAVAHYRPLQASKRPLNPFGRYCAKGGT